MRIYGVALLAGCFLSGQLVGVLLGQWIGIGGNVGGVGFGMLLLIYLNDKLGDKNPSVENTKDGIFFWSSMYIPIVIAMSATQNVKAAVSGGWVAILAGVLATIACFFLIPFITSFIKHKEEEV